MITQNFTVLATTGGVEQILRVNYQNPADMFIVSYDPASIVVFNNGSNPITVKIFSENEPVDPALSSGVYIKAGAERLFEVSDSTPAYKVIVTTTTGTSSVIVSAYRYITKTVKGQVGLYHS